VALVSSWSIKKARNNQLNRNHANNREGNLRWKMEYANMKKCYSNWYIVAGITTVITLSLIPTRVYGLILTFACISTGILSLSLYLVYALRQSKKDYAGKISKLADEYEQKQMDFRYELSDTSVKYSDQERQYDMAWSLFASYSVYEHNIILSLRSSQVFFFGEATEGPDAETYARMLALVKEKLPYKEIR
jgi:hypothetical protein